MKKFKFKLVWSLIFVLTISLSVFSACRETRSGNKEKISNLDLSDDSTKTSKDSIQTGSKKVKQKLEVDSQLTSFANFIAGLEDFQGYDNLKDKPFYKTHKAEVIDGWNKHEKTALNPINNWIQDVSITNSTDTGTLFYPFSGPDFLYGHAFFPHKSKYIMVGLEKDGTVPDFSKIKESDVQIYLDGLRSSLRYFNKVGYFMTKQMNMDFSKSVLNGNLHLIMLYMARTGHSIISVTKQKVNDQGQLEEIPQSSVSSKITYCVQIEFTDSLRERKRTLIYFPLDLSNGNMTAKPQFIKFMKSQGSFSSYMKSASYILHDGSFSLVRDVVSSLSTDILQDDTGLPYRILKANKYEMTFYGNYYRTIKDFKNSFQQDLKTAFDKQATKYKIPFNIGYSAWLTEMFLIHAKAATISKEKDQSSNSDVNKEVVSTKENTETSNIELVFKVQIKSSDKKPDFTLPEFAGLSNLSYYSDNGMYRYTVGNEKNHDACKAIKDQAIAKGFKDAFVIALKNGKRISIEEATKSNK